MADRFAAMWSKSRNDAGKSQDYMAKALGVSKKTIQNWEEGTSCPSQVKGFEWFSALGIQPLPYYLEMIYPEFEDIQPDDDARITEALLTFIRDTSPGQRKRLMYIIYGKHGSSPAAILEMIIAHLHTPLRARLNVALGVLTNYEVSASAGDQVEPDLVCPNIDTLSEAIERGKNSVLKGLDSYTLFK